MIEVMRIVWAFFMRNLQSALSYRFAMVLKYVGIAINLAIFFFAAKILRNFESPLLAQEGGSNYLTYVLTGGLCMTILGTAMGAMVGDIRSGQVMGTLETILASPMSIGRLLMGSWVYNAVRTGVGLLLSLVIFVFVLDFDPAMFRIDIAAAVFFTAMFAFTGLGILSAGFTLAYKKGDPVALFVGATFALFGGVIFPVAVLPGWLQPVADCIPISYATRAMRQSLLHAPEWSDVSTELMVLGGFGLVLVPLSVLFFWWALEKARRDGSLGHY